MRERKAAASLNNRSDALCIEGIAERPFTQNHSRIINGNPFMKAFNRILLSIILLLSAAGCSMPLSAASSADTSASVSVDSENSEISVIILAGQSNMEGNTWSCYVSEEYGFPEDEAERVNAGYPGILIDYRCFWNLQPDAGTSSDGKFEYVQLGQANNNSKFGPEIGIADYITKAGCNEGIALIKYAVGSSCLDPDAGEWCSPSSMCKENGIWYDNMLQFVDEGLSTLEKETGRKPVIKALCWMQGESDAINSDYTSRYYNNLACFVSDLRREWAEESKEGGFTFIDAYISDYWIGYQEINKAKQNFADEDSNNTVIDTISEGLEYNAQPVGNPDFYHYDATSMFKLGRLFGAQIIKTL